MSPRPVSDVDYWHARLRDGDLDADERARFERWRADPANAAALDELERVMARVDALMATPEMRAEADAALSAFKSRERRTPRVPRKPFLVWGGAAAAAAALLLAVLLGAFPGLAPPRPADSYQTAVGGREDVVLPDGSRVTLNTASEVRVRFTTAERRVVLDRGQALFVVASDPDRPFVVEADGATVTAVGTVFDVRKDVDGVVVTLVEGEVDVDVGPPARVSETASAAATHTTVPLQAGEQLRVDRARATAERRAADVEAALGWTDGVLIFRRTRLADAIAEVNRYTTEPLRLDDPSLAELELSGVFRAGDRNAFAWSLEQTFPVRLVVRGDVTLVTARAPDEPR